MARSIIVQTGKKHRFMNPNTPRLQTGLDSKISVQRTDAGAYIVTLRLNPPQGELRIAEYTPRAENQQASLPIFIEDVVTADRALVRIKYDPEIIELTIQQPDEVLNGQLVQIRATQVSAADLRIDTAPAPRPVGRIGFTVEDEAKVTQHLSDTDVDKELAAVASAEGGFASTEASDKGVFTWGQGQWTVTGGELQRVLSFIKVQRQDVFDRYWAAAGLDVRGEPPVFYYNGVAYATSSARMLALFRPSREQNEFWTRLFSQAGLDPQIQRLQREFMRGEVQQEVHAAVGNKNPDEWLNVRGKAFYYSMFKNSETWARKAFRSAVSATGLDQASGTATDEQCGQIAASLEDSFRNSGVIARDGQGHNHIIAFWGEGGRRVALAEADQHIQDPSLDRSWTTKQWQEQRARMVRRESRYQKTASDINRALAGTEIEPDVPADAQLDFGPVESE